MVKRVVMIDEGYFENLKMCICDALLLIDSIENPDYYVGEIDRKLSEAIEIIDNEEG